MILTVELITTMTKSMQCFNENSNQNHTNSGKVKIVDHDHDRQYLKLSSYLATKGDLKEEVQNRVGQPQAEGVLQVDLVALEHIVRILGAPVEYDPDEMILQHGNRGVRHIPLLGGESRVQILLVLGRQFLDDNGRIGDFLPIQFDERQLTLLGAETHLMIDILQRERTRR